ncbi:MAG: ribbon-helix-helix domain-containing protein [Anaerolineae bacterium]
MATKVRKQVYIESYQDRLLKQLAAETGVSEAEIIRQALDRHTRLFRFFQRDIDAWEKERAFITHLIRLGPVSGRRAWQREDLHER